MTVLLVFGRQSVSPVTTETVAILARPLSGCPLWAVVKGFFIIDGVAKRKTIDAPAAQQASGSSDVSILSSKMRAKDMAETPPLDIEAVGRIKEAISKGTYPIDLDQISNKLFENYLEMRK
mgnify:CR=1 FL=1